MTAVCDRGIGIPADELAQVFERFHRGRQVSSTNYGGLGLGLYITKQIIERHGGSIWVESKEGQGTTFYFSLPVGRAGRAVAAASMARRNASRRMQIADSCLGAPRLARIRGASPRARARLAHRHALPVSRSMSTGFRAMSM